MGGSFEIGRYSGIEVRVPWTFLLLVAFFAGADLFEEGLRALQQSGLRALPVEEEGELVGMLTIEDVGQARLLGTPPSKSGATAVMSEQARN